jgi:hypothetical protein
LIPAYNTPEHKFNIGLTGRDIDVKLFNKIPLRNLGFGINYKWVQGFQYEGSPQFTGYVPTYDMLDAQVSYTLKKISSTLSLDVPISSTTVSTRCMVGRRREGWRYFSVTVDLSK